MVRTAVRLESRDPASDHLTRSKKTLEDRCASYLVVGAMSHWRSLPCRDPSLGRFGSPAPSIFTTILTLPSEATVWGITPSFDELSPT